MADTLPQTPAPTSAEIVLRRATAADAQTLGALSSHLFIDTFVEGFGIDYPAEDIDSFIAASHAPAAYARMLADPVLALWLAETADGQAVGFASAGPCKLTVPGAAVEDGQLYRLYLVRAVQGSGLAHQLITTALDWLGASARPVWLGVWSGNDRAQRFYARYGFEKVAEFDDPIGKTIDLEFAMRRPAGPL